MDNFAITNPVKLSRNCSINLARYCDDFMKMSHCKTKP